ncbi:MAG: hypothetical protein R3237_05515 [Nitrosopumilaceae archaeon]|nr:hypothetical protein [Nitrosopumilaceae archaeon]
MKTASLISGIFFLFFLSSINSAHGLSCAPIELGKAFENSDYAFHGKVTDKNYLTWDLQMPVVTFEAIESFKGEIPGKISVTVFEQWSYDFEIGLEYVVFVQRNELSLVINPCDPIFQAFPSSIEIMREASIAGNDMQYQTSNVFYESLSDQEKIQYEENNKFLKEKRVERWDSILLQRQITIVSLISIVLVAGFVTFLIFRRKRK